MNYNVSMKVGNLVRKNAVWCDSKSAEMGQRGLVVRIEGSKFHVQWQTGKTSEHRAFELVVLDENGKTKKKPYYETWMIKF